MPSPAIESGRPREIPQCWMKKERVEDCATVTSTVSIVQCACSLLFSWQLARLSVNYKLSALARV